MTLTFHPPNFPVPSTATGYPLNIFPYTTECCDLGDKQPFIEQAFSAVRFDASLSVEVKQRYEVSAWMGDQVVARYIWWQSWDNDNCLLPEWSCLAHVIFPCPAFS